MGKTWVLGILVASVCGAQSHASTPAEVDALDADYRASLRGVTEDVTPLSPIQPRASSGLSAAGSVSVAQLRHKPTKNARKFVARGAVLSQAGDHRGAAEEFERAVAADPEFANAHYGLGVQYAQLGRYAEAEAELQRSLILDPYFLAGHYDLAVVLYQTGDLSGAERSVRRALELSKTDVQVRILLGLLLSRQVETRAEAFEHLKYAALSSPEAKELLVSLGGK